ncbi:UDP-4-amino-4,6-dideoxy-N-acetyl-beta-L-altrosamine N-acetyltransferase [Trinickia symbiotica]|uniref:UDP-4-amino-4, 6-dideoxy-N-acetyl-beta-L-altrosamine N-acetyltransferase n=1 Tax=Trinickia symbiotica TaxID=863227 RepID=A0A2T3XNI3_9BURK|nr:UDP-4-amino-4,6-dideoxy-N-acetyl-beta-L-altrosamine N-acetyltransferase [Trinickia symbiotica]PTB18082.1 UDP-4-amino-4,6-dideoxy-N-acetyl-beta-L-altrosamine N-acetyltransferase [Trinickia symbiotica]
MSRATRSDSGDSLRLLREADLEQVLAWRNTPEVRAVMYTSREIDWAEHAAWFERLQRDRSRCTCVFMADGEPMGVVNFTHIDTMIGEAHWGFYVRPGAPKGIGIRLGRVALAHAFELLKLNRLIGEVLASNEASLRFHRKLGFELEQILGAHHRDGNTAQDVHVFSLARAAWRRDRATDKRAPAFLGETP